MLSYPTLLTGYVHSGGAVYYIKSTDPQAGSVKYCAKKRAGLDTEIFATGVSLPDALFALASQMPKGDYRLLT